MAALNEASVQRKFANVNNTQDNIQSLSLWVLHHKAHHERIVELWYKSLKKGKFSNISVIDYFCVETTLLSNRLQIKFSPDLPFATSQDEMCVDQ